MRVSVMGRRPIVSRAVLPVPTPSSTRPGANWLMVAIEWATVGAMRVVGTATPVPSRIFDVSWAAKAIVAYTSE